MKSWALDTSESGHKFPFDVILHKRDGAVRKKPAAALGHPMPIQSGLQGATTSFRAQCTSCVQTSQNQCTWIGKAGFWIPTARLCFYQRGSHSPLGQRKRGGTLSTVQRWILNARKKAGRRTSAWSALAAMSHLETSPPDKTQISSSYKNAAKRSRRILVEEEDGQAASVIDPDRWQPWDFDAALAHLGLCELESPDMMDIDPDTLLLLGRTEWADDQGRPCCAAVLGTKEMLTSVSRCTNPSYMKLCVDGHYKLNFGGRCTLPFGFLSKHYAKTSVTGADGKYIWSAWLTQFNALGFVMATSEAEEAIGLGLERMAAHIDASLPDKFPLPFLQCIRQLHADLTPAAECARARLLPNSLRAADYWHCREAMIRNMKEKLVIRNPDGEKVYLKVLLHLMKVTRTIPVLTEFYMVWAFTFQRMDTWGEDDAVASFKSTYFFRMPIDEINRRFPGCMNVPLEDGGVICAAWWSGFQRIQPGSALGSQSQESFHRLVLLEIMQDDAGASEVE